MSKIAQYNSDDENQKPNNSNNEQNNNSSSPDDSFEAQLRMNQDFAENSGAKKQLITVPVRRPDKQWYFRVHPDENYRMPAVLIELKDLQETYIVHRNMQSALPPGEVSYKMLYTAMNRAGVTFIWAVTLPSNDGRRNHWSESALKAAELGMKDWIKIVPNMSLGAYEVSVATGNLPEPVWTPLTFQELLRLAFKDRIISDPNHPVLRNLRGEL